MTINVTIASPVYSKAPIPYPIPDPNLFPFEIAVGNHPAWISIPKPDKLHIKGLLLPEHFNPKLELVVENYGPWLMSKLASKAIGAVLDTKYIELTGTYTAVLRGFGQANAPVFFELSYAKADPVAAHSLTIQCNPSRLGEEGFFELLDQVAKLTGGGFIFGAFLADARIKLLDIAVDVVGAKLSDLVVRTKDQGMRANYVPNNGSLQSYSIHRQQKSQCIDNSYLAKKGSPLGDLIARVYDKRKERIEKGQSPKFGDAPETRIELQRKRFGNKPFHLLMLRKMTNPFSKLAVGSAIDALPDEGSRWLRYIFLRQTIDHEMALSVMPLSAASAQAFKDAYGAFPKELVTAKAIWENWAKGINVVGLHYLLEAAEQNSIGVPLPSEAVFPLHDCP